MACLLLQSHRMEINAVLKKEAGFSGDIVILSFIDRYELVVLKTVSMCQYGVRHPTTLTTYYCARTPLVP